MTQEDKNHNARIRRDYSFELFVTGRPARIKPPFRLWRKVRKLFKGVR